MSDINWDLAPEGALEVVQYGNRLTWRKGIKIWCFVQEKWCDYVSDWQTIATRPQPERKTVEDAVEYYGGQFPDADDIAIGIAYSNNRISPFYKGSPISKGTNSPDSYIICTREEFEACVAAKEGNSKPEWTHIHGGGKKCRVLAVDGAESWVLDENGNKVTEFTNSLKPIKPTITTSEKEKCAVMAGYFNINPAEFDEYMSKYEVTND